jgi:hypothetical protein
LLVSGSPPSRRSRPSKTSNASLNADRVRQALRARGLTVAMTPSDASRGRAEAATIQPAELIEDATLECRPVGPALRWPPPVAFLDGTQRTDVVAYAGSAPIVLAEIAAAVRERADRTLLTVVSDRRFLAIARPSALAAAGDAIEGYTPVAAPDDEPPHPVRDLNSAARVVDRARAELEVAVGARYRAVSAAWLVVDGSLSESFGWATDPRVVGIAKSHATLPFDGEALERYLRLPFAHRTSVFAPRSRSVAPVRAWALRLWPWEGRDLFHGLVRVEVAPVNGTPAQADELSRWLLSERSPLSTPDPRWDRLLYGIHSVEAYLRAGGR